MPLNVVDHLPSDAHQRTSNPYLSREWDGYLALPDMPRYTPSQRPGGGSAVYFLFGRTGALKYVGQTMSIRSRIEQHVRNGRTFSTWGFVEVPADLLTHVETAYIDALRPKDNRGLSAPKVLQHEAMVHSIRSAWGKTCSASASRPRVN